MKSSINTVIAIIASIHSGMLFGADKEEELLRKAQGILFRKMEQNNTPLYGWNQFGAFVDSIREGLSFEEAYDNALKEPAVFRVKIVGGDGSEENPWILE